MDSLLTLPFEEHDGPHSWRECWVVAELSHPVSCSARELTTRAAPLGWHAPDVVKWLTVQTHRVHVVMLESLRSTVSSEALDRSRFTHGLSPPVVVADDLDDDERVAGTTVCPDGARILQARCDEHDLRSRSWEQVVGSSFACLSGDRPVYKFGNSEISSVEAGVLVLRLGGSPRGWFNEFVTENYLVSGDKDFEESHLWVRAYGLVGCCDQLSVDGSATLEHVGCVIQSFVDAV